MGRPPRCTPGASLVTMALVLASFSTCQAFKPHCHWSGMIIVPFVPQTDLHLLKHRLITGCDDQRLDEERRGHCRLCEAQASRKACLATKAQHWHGDTDVETCAWQTQDALGQDVYELGFTLGANVPFMFSSRIHAAGKDDVCSTRRQYTVHNTWGYSAAYFSVYGDGDLPDGSPLPDGMRPDASCVVKPPRRSCTLRFHHTPDMQWEISSRDIWTQNPGIIKRLNATGNEDCLFNASQPCVAAKPPFQYTVKITAEKCHNRSGNHSAVIQCGGAIPMGQPGYLLYPKAVAATYREVLWSLDGLRHARWNVSSKVPLLAMVLPKAVEEKVCPPWLEKTVCDFQAVANQAIAGTSCYGKKCTGRVHTKPGDKLVFVVTYPRFTAAEKVLPAQTPPTTAVVDLHGWR